MLIEISLLGQSTNPKLRWQLVLPILTKEREESVVTSVHKKSLWRRSTNPKQMWQLVLPIFTMNRKQSVVTSIHENITMGTINKSKTEMTACATCYSINIFFLTEWSVCRREDLCFAVTNEHKQLNEQNHYVMDTPCSPTIRVACGHVNRCMALTTPTSTPPLTLSTLINRLHGYEKVSHEMFSERFPDCMAWLWSQN